MRRLSFLSATGHTKRHITLVFCGDPLNPQLLLLGICATTPFVSMWMHNTPTTVMMMPIATGIIQRLPSESAIVILCLVYCPRGCGETLSAYLDKAHIKRELDLLGLMAFAEKMVLAVFSTLVVLWMTRSITDDVPGWGALFNDRVGDGTVSVMMATLLFNIVLLLGAGLVIADGVRTSGVADVLSTTLDFLGQTPYWAVAPTVCVISGIMTELITSNNATTTIIIPLLIEIARNINVHLLLLMVPGAIGAQFAFLLPTATPSNVIGFTTGHIDIIDMLKTGLPLKLAGTIALSILMPTLGSLVFVNLKTGEN
ncbi:hypothetical protein L1987_28348 [Smallanthus sonchifolius]|uniref:Uncharacterized protein n=1 Tax=Smallanthus sonchifolius TaxID=185202 RepID=A0ACB9HYG2_9ASTR|nr:hypothetical protein L1987_28348 [Smallanthus sonchifolius]